MNGVYIRSLSEEELAERLLPFWQDAGLVPDPCPERMRPRLVLAASLVQERLKRLDEVVEWTGFMFGEIETPPMERLVPKGLTPEESREMLEAARDLMVEIEPFEAETIEQPLRDLTDALGVSVGQLLGTLRWVTTNQKATPPLFGSLAAMGRERVLKRLDRAIERLERAS
jgi:glutamyl-tRNA synthetase